MLITGTTRQKPRLALGLDFNNQPNLTIYNENMTEPAMVLGQRGLWLKDDNGNTRVILGAAPELTGLIVVDKTGKMWSLP
jgi:hypothetical protein